MTERARLFQAAADEPHDDGPRLVLADWLEEHGEEERGTFVRTGVALARMDEADDAYPETLARHLRSASFAVEPKEPWIDHIPGVRVWFGRGMPAGVALSPEDYLAAKPAAWKRAPLEELVLYPAKEEAAARAVARRGELARLRLLGLCRWYRHTARHLLCGCKHLAGLRELFLESGLWDPEGGGGPTPEAFAAEIDLPALDAFSWRQGDVMLWPTLVPALGRPSRLMLESGSGSELDEGADAYGWLVGTPLWRGLRRANVWHNINSIGYSTVYQTDPLPDLGRSFAAAPLEDFRLAVADIPGFASLRSWGELETLRLGYTYLTDILAPVTQSPKARRLRRLFLDHPDGPYPEEGTPALDALAGRSLAGLRHLRFDTYHFTEGELAGLRHGAYRKNLLRLELGEYGPPLNADQVRELLAQPWPRLRHLRIGLDNAEALAALAGSDALPTLCTLTVVGWPTLSLADIRALARAPGMPRLSLLVLGEREWILSGGEARQVNENVLLAERETLRDGPYRR